MRVAVCDTYHSVKEHMDTGHQRYFVWGRMSESGLCLHNMVLHATWSQLPCYAAITTLWVSCTRCCKPQLLANASPEAAAAHL